MVPARPVRWKEGMFLRPHHFQQHELCLEARSAALVRAVAPLGWGVRQLELNEAALDNHVFELRAFSAVFPSGTVVELGANARLAARGFEALMAEAGRPLEVHVGLRRRDDQQAQSSEDEQAPGTARYLVRRLDVTDRETGADAQPLEFLDLNLQLLFGGEPAAGFETLPVARLVRTGNRARPVVLDPHFAPPALELSAAPALHAAGRATIERLSTVLRALADVRGSQNPGHHVLYQALSGSLAVLRELAGDGLAHPRQVYLELARLAGTLLYRDETGRTVDDIPPYDHAAPAPVFERLRQLIVELSEPAFDRRWTRTPLGRAGDLFRCTLPAEAKRPGARLVLEAQAVESTPRLRTILLGAKISSPVRIDTLTRHALPGIPTEMLTSPPPELPPGQAGSFFRLQVEAGAEWSTHVAPGDELAAFLLGAPADIALQLVTILPEA